MALLGAAAAAQQTANTAPVKLDRIVQRMEQAAAANRANYHAYTVTRDFQFFGSGDRKPASDVTAEISFIPPATKEFRILRAEGSSRGEHVVRHILEGERKAAESGKAPGAVTSENYNFVYLGEGELDGHACYILGLVPKRRETALITGRAWVDQRTYLVRQMDGDMAKLPSWWLKSVHVTLGFGSIDGMWIQQNTKAVAEVRIFGTHVLDARAVKFEAGTAEARTRLPRRSRADYALGVAVR